MRKPTIGIVGTGHFGTALIEELFRRSFASRLFVYNRTEIKAIALAEELRRLGEVELDVSTSIVAVKRIRELQTSESLIICAKERYQYADCVKERDHQDPEFLRDYAIEKDSPGIAKMAATMRGFPGVVLMITNPVEYMCKLWIAHSGCAPNKILGLGLSLDAARVTRRIKRLHPHVDLALITLGLHGAMAFVADFASRINNDCFGAASSKLKLDSEKLIQQANLDAVSRVLRYGYTSFEPAHVFAHDIQNIFSGASINASGINGNTTGEIDLTPCGGLFQYRDGAFQSQRCKFSSRDLQRQKMAISALGRLLTSNARYFR